MSTANTAATAKTPETAAHARPEYSESGFALMLGQYSSMQVVVAITGLVRNKVVALRLGPSAFGEIAQLAAVVGAVVTFVSFGMQVSVSRNVAKASTFAERQAYLANANGLVLTLSLVATTVMFALLTAGHLLQLIGVAVAPEAARAAGLFLAAIPFLALQANYLSLLLGLLDVRGMAVQRSIAVLGATAIAVPIIWIYGYVGAAANFLILSILLTLLLGLRCRALGYNWLACRIDPGRLAVLASFGVVSMASGFAQTLSDTAVRASLIAQFGATENGLLQAPLVVAMTLKTILLGSIGSVSLSTVAGVSSVEDITKTIDRLLNIVVPLSAVALGLLGLLGVPAMIVLYATEFSGGAVLLPYILTADLVLVFVWVIGAPLLGAGDRTIWLALELVHSGVRWALCMALLPGFGSAAVGIGMLVAVVLYLFLIGVTIRMRYGVRVSREHGVRLLVGIALVALLAVTGAHGTTSIPVMGAAAVLWAGYVAYQIRAFDLLAGLKSLMAARPRSR